MGINFNTLDTNIRRLRIKLAEYFKKPGYSSHRNKLVTKQTLEQNNFTYSNKLKPGLCYWKLFY